MCWWQPCKNTNTVKQPAKIFTQDYMLENKDVWKVWHGLGGPSPAHVKGRWLHPCPTKTLTVWLLSALCWTCKSRSFLSFSCSNRAAKWPSQNKFTSDPWQITHQVVPLYVQQTLSCRRVNNAFLTPGKSHFYRKHCAKTPALTNRTAAQLCIYRVIKWPGMLFTHWSVGIKGKHLEQNGCNNKVNVCATRTLN